jgi:hypothetical protein
VLNDAFPKHLRDLRFDFPRYVGPKVINVHKVMGIAADRSVTPDIEETAAWATVNASGKGLLASLQLKIRLGP